MQKILIVEDDIDIQDILKNHLIDAGYEVAVASDGVAGIAMFDDTIDLVLLDIMLPKIDGYGVCEVIRKRSQVPIIMLTALSDEENQLKGFEQQIDDYIPKPFSPKILLCKIAAILRRRMTDNQNQSLLTYKELSMDVDGFHVYQGGNEVVLTSKEFALLRLMLENQGKVFTRQMLLDRLWADDLEVEDRIVDSHIDDFLETVRRYTDATTITKRMVAELIDHIEVYHAEKQDGITNQRVVIYYNCIGDFDVPDRRKIPEADIIMETRKGVALSYAPEQVAV